MTATGDRHLLKIALENLLGNAWKFTGDVESPMSAHGALALKDPPPQRSATPSP